ncbi:hypothetical protein QX204_23265 [Nocardia sp. PE-7]|uniref:hypothetical protein n=1 Tax=Nocardia sp. PE-7 TaxID=3058426 RepID=UPI00265A4EA8|nr:hypothetical protein [Nocardia sp. PE-7]WKG07976.1 hypothetical protein QX204_23265 [Nocardia sp. PE-7]
MTDLITRAQLILLARTLHVHPQRLDHLRYLGADRLHALNQQISGVLFDQHTETFRRISSLVPFIPLTMSIPLVQKLVPPMMTGRAAGSVGLDHPGKAAETLMLLDAGYAADCAPYLDPRAIEQLVDQMAPGPIVEILNELLRRRDYITVGPFLACATPEVLAAVEVGVRDDAGLIFSAAFSYDVVVLSAVIRQLLDGPHKRVPQMAQTVLSGSSDLQHAALSVFSRCAPDVIRRVGDILFGSAQPGDVARLVRNALALGAVPEFLTLAGYLTPLGLWTLVGNPVFNDPDVGVDLVAPMDARKDAESWRGLFTLMSRMDGEVRSAAGYALALLPESAVAELPARATETGCWPALLDLVAVSGERGQARFGAIWAQLAPERRAYLHRCITELRYDTRLAEITALVEPVEVDLLFYQRRQKGRYRG